MDGPAAASQHPPAACTLQEAATLLGVSINTLRRKIATGQVRAEQVARPQGHVWRVYLDGQQGAGQQATEPPDSRLQQPPTDLQRAEAMAAYSTALLAPLVAELATTRVKLVDQAEMIGRQAGQLASLDIKLAATDAYIKALEASAPQNGQQGVSASNLTAQGSEPPLETPTPPPPAPVPSPTPEPTPPPAPAPIPPGPNGSGWWGRVQAWLLA